MNGQQDHGESGLGSYSLAEWGLLREVYAHLLSTLLAPDKATGARVTGEVECVIMIFLVGVNFHLASTCDAAS